MHAERQPERTVYLAVPGTLDTLTGGYRYDRRIVEELAKQGWKADVLSLDASFPTPTVAALAGAQACFARIPDGARVVIDGLALAGAVPLLPAIAGRLDTIALIHHPLADETGIDAERAAQLRAAEKAALAHVARIIVTSPWTRRRLSAYGVAPDRISVIEPGIDRGVLPAQERSAAPTVRLLTVATITRRKGHAILVEALRRLKSLDWSLRCVGSLDLDRECADSLRAQIVSSGLSDRVTLLGELAPETLRDEYLDADLFVLASHLEGYGMSLAEAIAHGLPVVSTTAGAIPDTVPWNASRLVPPGNVEALTEALRDLIADGHALDRLAAGARAAAANVRTWAEAAQSFAAVLNRGAAA